MQNKDGKYKSIENVKFLSILKTNENWSSLIHEKNKQCWIKIANSERNVMTSNIHQNCFSIRFKILTFIFAHTV